MKDRKRKDVYAVMFDCRLHSSHDLEIVAKVAGELGEIHKVVTVDQLDQDAWI